MTDSMEKVLEIVSKDCLVPSTDFKDANFVVSISSDLRKFLRFFCEEKLYHIVIWSSVQNQQFSEKIMHAPWTLGETQRIANTDNFLIHGKGPLMKNLVIPFTHL